MNRNDPDKVKQRQQEYNKKYYEKIKYEKQLKEQKNQEMFELLMQEDEFNHLLKLYPHLKDFFNCSEGDVILLHKCLDKIRLLSEAIDKKNKVNGIKEQS